MKKFMLICSLFIASVSTVAQAQTSKAGVSSDPVEKARGLKKQLNLSDDQTSKVAVIYKESAQKYDKIKAEEKGNTDKMLVAIKPLRVATIKKIKAVLTPAQQLKYDKLIKESKNSSLNSGWSDGWSSTSEN